MKDAAIIIPSAGRATAVLTRTRNSILYVPESEGEAYRANNPETKIETHADNAHGNLAEKRQDIYKRWGNDRPVFMLDDDIAFVSRLYMPGNNRQQHLTEDEVEELINVTAANAKAAGCYLFGFNATPNAKHYYPHKPIELTAYINASAFGLWPSERLYFTERTTAAESHWINLLNAYIYRKAWVDMRFHFSQATNSTFKRQGGQTAHRTLETERADTLFLRRMFGQAVRIKRNRGDSAKIHPYQRSINNPL